jgi:hypothetical protein
MKNDFMVRVIPAGEVRGWLALHGPEDQRTPRWINLRENDWEPKTIPLSELRAGKAFLDGVDVTKDCFYADERKGEVQHYLLNAEGKHYRHGDGPALGPVLHGQVKIILAGESES